MQVTFGMEFQTPDANFLLYREDRNAAYFTRTRTSFPLSVKPDKKEWWRIHIHGDGATNTVVKKFIASTPPHKEHETILVTLKNQWNWWKKELILAEPLNEMYNDAEFDVLLLSPRTIPLDRESILHGIHGAISEGASCLRETLKDSISSSANIDGTTVHPSGENIELPYRRVFWIEDKQDKQDKQDKTIPYCMLGTSLKPVSSFSYFTQVTMGIPFPHVLLVLQVITQELLENKGTNGLSEEDQLQLQILPEAEKQVQTVMEKNNPLYDMTVLMVYWVRTRPNRKKSPFLIRHHMVQLVNTMLTREEKIQLLETLSKLSFQYRQVIQTLVDKEFKDSRLFFRKFQNTNKSTLFQVETRPENFLIEIRYVYALLNTWCRHPSVKSLHTLSSLTHMPPLHFPKRTTKRKRSSSMVDSR